VVTKDCHYLRNLAGLVSNIVAATYSSQAGQGARHAHQQDRDLGTRWPAGASRFKVLTSARASKAGSTRIAASTVRVTHDRRDGLHRSALISSPTAGSMLAVAPSVLRSGSRRRSDSPWLPARRAGLVLPATANRRRATRRPSVGPPLAPGAGRHRWARCGHGCASGCSLSFDPDRSAPFTNC
jgi:hypothetical protein